MSIVDQDLRKVLSAHARRISRDSSRSRRVASAGSGAPNPVAQSIEARRRQVVAKITGDIVANLGQRHHRLVPEIDDPRDIALDRLSLEYGRSLFLEYSVQGNPRFMISNPELGGEMYLLPPDEQEVLIDRLACLEDEVRASLAP
ncbi:MAG: hypothetical protein KQI62_09905 [Deltaproteobacteria bacterium]|nr:hypothetical protein [Deltaproteobacteria bacterium]